MRLGSALAALLAAASGVALIAFVAAGNLDRDGASAQTAESPTPAASPSPPACLGGHRLDVNKLDAANSKRVANGPVSTAIQFSNVDSDTVSADLAGRKVMIQGAGEVVVFFPSEGIADSDMFELTRLVDEVRYAC